MSERFKRFVLIGMVVVTIVPVPLLVSRPNWALATSVWLYVSASMGYAGLVLLFWMYLLGTKSVTGLYFRDLAPVLAIHKWFGKWGTLLVFFHPVATAISYGDNVLAYTFIPDLDSSFERSVTWGRFALYSLAIVWLTSAIVRSRIAFRPWRYVHLVSYVALPLALVHVPSIGSSYRSLAVPRIYFTSILLLLVLFSVIRLRHLFTIGRSRYVVVKHQQVGSDVWLIVLRPLGRAITIARGQYVYLQWSLFGEEHPFTVLQRLDQTGEMTVAYKTVGHWTKKLARLQDGDVLFVDGPYGAFLSDIPFGIPQPSVYIAAGIGVTPFIDPIFTGLQLDSWLFYANQSLATATFLPQLQAHMGGRFVSILSRVDTPAAPNDERGHFSADIVRRYIANPAWYHYYICGPEGFMDAAEKALRKAGVAASHIHIESFGW